MAFVLPTATSKEWRPVTQRLAYPRGGGGIYPRTCAIISLLNPHNPSISEASKGDRNFCYILFPVPCLKVEGKKKASASRLVRPVMLNRTICGIGHTFGQSFSASEGRAGGGGTEAALSESSVPERGGSRERFW